MPSFYTPDLTPDSSVITLSEAERHHAVTVRRVRAGESVRVINGRGLIGAGRLHHAPDQPAIIELDSDSMKQFSEPRVVLASALPKGDRVRTMIDMATQLGMARFIPLICARSVQKASDNLIDKVRRYALEACKQADNPWLPRVEAAATLDGLTREQFSEFARANRLIADADGASLDQLLFEAGPVVILVGPEGGFDESERALLSQFGVAKTKLAQSILRTETAAITAVAMLQHNLTCD